MKKIYSLLFLVFVSITTQAQVVISQVYGGGGNANATYTHDFVELFNKGNATVDISDYSIQYASATGTNWAVNAIPSGTTIAPGKYFLIKLAGSTNGVALPTPDLDLPSTASNLSGTAGKVALVNNTTALTGTVVTTGYVDLLGYGSTATSFETAFFATTGTNNTLSFQRLNNGCTETDNNSTDFTLSGVNPRNSATPTYSCSAPSISISSPTNNTVYSPETTSVDINITVNNFTVANGSGNGHISYTINGGSPISKFDTTPIVLPTTQGNYTVFMQLVNNANQPLSPVASTTLNFTVASYNVVADLAALRADVVANGANRYYQLSSAPVITYARTARNQKYVQDSSAGILIDDVAGTITTSFAAGDSMTGLKGQATLFSSLLQFVPTVNASVGTSGNTVAIQAVTIADLNSSVAAATYESELVQLNNVTFDLTNPTFPTTALNMNVTNGTDTLVFRSIFTEADYMGTAKPTAATNIIVLVGRAGAVAQVASRSASDLNAPFLSNSDFNSIDGLKLYPNPVANGKLFIETTANAERTVTVFDVLGKQVLNTISSENEINVSELNTGVYLVKISEEGKTATRKLVVR
jgi:hypothetical protein